MAFSEPSQAQKYLIGQEFKDHVDYFMPALKRYNEYMNIGGNRTWTFMIYLNEVPDGGGTRFTHLSHTFQPKKGMAVVWNNLLADGRQNPHTLHSGMPVLKGEKLIITKWFREKTMAPMFYPE